MSGGVFICYRREDFMDSRDGSMTVSQSESAETMFSST